MTETTYTYSISEDFLNGVVNTSSLTTEIQESAITIALDHIDTNDGYCDIIFKSALSSGEEEILSGIVAIHTGESEEPDPLSVKITAQEAALELNLLSTDTHMLRVAQEKTSVSRKTLYSHDWCDPTTWYEQSVRVDSEITQNTGDNKRYSLSNNNIIDIYHGKLSEEDELIDSDGYSYRVIVKVNDVQKVEQDPHYGSGGDYTIDYNDGYIDFTSALDPSDEVSVTYHYENGSRFTIKPSSGKELKIMLAEVQFSTDIELNDSIHFDTYGYAGVFAPQLGLPPTMLIKIQGIIYKTMKDFYTDSIRTYPKMYALGGTGWRGANFDMVVMDWDYVSASTIYSTCGMETRVFLEHDEPCNGSYASVTFYCTSENCSYGG